MASFDAWLPRAAALRPDVPALIDGDGARYLHFAGSNEVADGAGEASFTIEPALRAPFDDGDAVLLAAPTVEGALIEGGGRSLAVDRLVRFGAVLTIEEAA